MLAKEVIGLVSRYTCPHCKRLFTSLSSLKRHIQVYSDFQFTFPCCGEQFLWSKDSLQHACYKLLNVKSPNEETSVCDLPDLCSDDQGSGDENTEFTCENCSAKFSRYQTLKNHILKFPEKHDFICQMCKKQFLTEKALQSHLCLLVNFSFQCSCKEFFTNLKEFKSHVGSRRPYFCCACSHKNLSFNNLLNHIRSHTKENPFSCNICKRTFRVRESLTAHKKLHKEKNQFQCSKCVYATSRKWNLQLHEKQHNPERRDEKQFLCSVCGKSFYFKHHLRRHTAIHSSKNPHLCRICGKLFSQNSYLEKHLKNHKKDSDIGQKCVVCGIDLHKGQLYAHHLDTGHFQHVCHACRAVFLTKFNLQRHLKNHNKRDVN